jgi:hypothetical protein
MDLRMYRTPRVWVTRGWLRLVRGERQGWAPYAWPTYRKGGR